MLHNCSLDRIERDEEIYIEQLRTSSLVYRAPSTSDIAAITTGSDSNHYLNSGHNPVVGVSSSSKLMSDILVQFHQEAESIDLLGVKAIQDCDSNATGDNKSSSSTSFFQRHQSQFQELLFQHQQKRSRGSLDSNNNISASNIPIYPSATTTGPSKSESLAVKRSSINEHDDVSHSSSMMMMSMNSSTTTIMSP
jgi:hypothetical protein